MDGKQYVGYVSDYIFADDNGSKGIDAIIIDRSESESPIWFNNDEISFIECIMDSKRVELLVHTGMSDNDGINTAGDYINEVLRDFMPAVAITEHDSVRASPEAYNALVKTNSLEKWLSVDDKIFKMENLALSGIFFVLCFCTHKGTACYRMVYSNEFPCKT